MSESNENLDEIEQQLLKSLAELREKKHLAAEAIRLEEERKRQEEYERLRREEEEKRNKPVIVTVHSVIDYKFVLFTIDHLREDIKKWTIGTYIVDRYMKHAELENAYTAEALGWNHVVESLSKFHNLTIEYKQGIEEEIAEVKNAPHFTVDEHKEGFKVIINPTAEYYAYTNLQSIPGSKPVAGTHSKEWIIPFIYSFMLIQKLNEKKVKFTPKADERIKAELELRDELDRIAKLEDTDEINIELKGDTKPRPFQKVGALFGIKKNGNFILADEMGLGKTIQALMIMVLLKRRFIVVCPAGLKENWYREMMRKFGIEAIVMSGAIPDENDIITMMVQKPQVVIINYDLIAKAVEIKGEVYWVENEDGSKEKKKKPDVVKWPWVELINNCGFDNILYDEAHRLKNPESKRSQASRLITIPNVLPITGTPITNRPQEYWSLLKLVAPNEMPNYEQFTQRYVSLDGKRAANVEELRHLVKPFLIRRTKAQVVADLPAIIRTTNLHILSEPARKLYKKAEEGLYQTIKAFDAERADEDQLINSVLTQILRMKQICAWDKVDNTVDLGVTILDSYEEGELNNKLIIFTQFVDLVEEVRKRISGDFETVAFTGETPMTKRYDMCDRFQTDPSVRVLVTTMRTASEGLTLTRAGAVIFNDFGWTPAEHEQAEARCYGRLNDMHGARSYYHAAANTVEDWIQELLLRKMAIINQIVDGVEIARGEDSSILKEIIKRIKEG